MWNKMKNRDERMTIVSKIFNKNNYWLIKIMEIIIEALIKAKKRFNFFRNSLSSYFYINYVNTKY